MNHGPTAFALFRTSFASVLDAVGVCVLVWLGYEVMFGGSQPFETEALWVASIGVAACLIAPGARRNVPLAMLAYVALACVSAAASEWPVTAAEPRWLGVFAPASYQLAMLMFVLGVAHLLRTPQRIAAGVVLFVAAITILGVQLTFDRVGTNFQYIRGGSVSLPSVSQWGGLHQLGMLLVLAFAFPAAVALTTRSWERVVAGVVLSGFFLIVSFVNASNGGIVVVALLAPAMIAVIAARRLQGKRQRLILVVPLLLGTAGFLFAVATGRISALAHGDLAGRLPIWRAAATIWWDHFWLGAGPGRYSAEIAAGQAGQYLPQFNPGGALQAHNTLLQAAAETGLLGAISLLAWWLWTLRACWLAWVQGLLPTIAFGLLFALVGFIVRSMTDNFMDGLFTTDRTRVLVWSLFAAVLALSRLSAVDEVIRR